MWLLAGMGVAAIDFFTGPYIQFPFFFLVPVALASWYSGRMAGIFLAVCLPLIRPLYFAEAWNSGIGWTAVSANALIKILVFASFAELIHRIAEGIRFRAQALRCLPVGMWVADGSGRIVQTNPAATAIWGEDALGQYAETLGRRRSRHDTGALLGDAENSLVRALDSGEATVGQLLDVAQAGGGRRVVLESASPILDERGRITGALLVHQDITDSKRLEEEREGLLRSLEQARKDLKILGGLLPVCAGCKRIRDERGEWLGMESYLTAHSEADVSHGICPECLRRLYPDFTEPP